MCMCMNALYEHVDRNNEHRTPTEETNKAGSHQSKATTTTATTMIMMTMDAEDKTRAGVDDVRLLLEDDKEEEVGICDKEERNDDNSNHYDIDNDDTSVKEKLSLTTERLALYIIQSSPPHMALFLSPLVTMFTTIVFMSIYLFGRDDGCENAREFQEDYDTEELISHAMCCLPEYPIGAVGLSIGGLLGLYSVPYIWSLSSDEETLAVKEIMSVRSQCCCWRACNCCCFGKVGGEDNTSKVQAVVIALTNIGLVVVAIVSLCYVEVYTHVTASMFYFGGGIILMFTRLSCNSLCRHNMQRPYVEQSDPQNLLNDHCERMSLWSKRFIFLGMLCFVISFGANAISTESDVAGESLLGMVVVLATYSLLSDLLTVEIIKLSSR